MPGFLKEIGDSTHMFGKWNIRHCNSKYLPHERGFDHFLGYLCPGHGYKVETFLSHFLSLNYWTFLIMLLLCLPYLQTHDCGYNADVHDLIEGLVSKDDSGDVTYAWSTGTQYQGTLL